MVDLNEIVLVPGLGSDGAVWTRTINELGDGFRCVVGDTLKDRSLAEMARRILAEAPARFLLAGVSMGGMVALEVMRLEPHRVRALAIVDSNAFPDTAEQAEQRRRTLAAVRAGVDLRAAGQASLAWLVHPTAPTDVREEIVEMGVRVGADVYAAQIEAVLARSDQRPLLASIEVPTVVVTGAEDAMIPESFARAIVTAIPAARLEIIPGCGHLPPIEKPTAMARHLRDLALRAPA